MVICRGTKPSQAAKSLPRAKAAPLPIAATKAVAAKTKAVRDDLSKTDPGGDIKL